MNHTVRFIKSSIFSIVLVFSIFSVTSYAASSQFGESGYLYSPTTDNAGKGSIQGGVWLNYTRNEGETSTIMPLSVSMGLGTGTELYGSYPNISMNDQNDESMRGYQNLGIKQLIIGGSSSKFKACLDVFMRQTLSDNNQLDGLTDWGGRFIVGYEFERSSVNLNIGYLKVDSPKGDSWDNETLYGGVLAFPLTRKLEFFIDVDGNTSRSGESSRLEIAPGIQYFISPQVSLVGGIGVGTTNTGPDLKVITGLTFTGGVGSYIEAIPIIPGSRERYRASLISPEELMPDLLLGGVDPVATGTGEVKPIEAPAAGGVLGTMPAGLETAPSLIEGIAKTGQAADGVPLTSIELPSPALEPPMPVLKTLPGSEKGMAPIATMQPEIVAEVPPVVFSPPAPVQKGEVRPDQKVGIPSGDIKETTPSLSSKDKTGPAVVAASSVETQKTDKQSSPKIVIKIKDGIPIFILSATFKFNSHELTKEGELAMDQLAENILKEKDTLQYLSVEGHTDNVGSPDFNLKLSRRRADTVINYFRTRHNLEGSLLKATGYGEDRPVASNDTEEGRAQNRRVEIFLIKKASQ